MRTVLASMTRAPLKHSLLGVAKMPLAVPGGINGPKHLEFRPVRAAGTRTRLYRATVVPRQTFWLQGAEDREHEHE